MVLLDYLIWQNAMDQELEEKSRRLIEIQLVLATVHHSC